jgi:uncharacterized protein YkwD
MAWTLDIWRGALLAFAVALALGATTFTTAESADAAQKCARADAEAGQANSQQLGESVACLIDRQRKEAGAKELAAVPSLTSVAEKHTDVMIRKDCLQHRCQGEDSLEDRIVRSGYPIAGGRYAFAEVTGCASTPRGMVQSWMDSRPHRKRLLGKAYRHIGVGPAKGDVDLARCDGKREVFTVIFGWRRG